MFEPKRLEEREVATARLFNKQLDDCLSIATDEFLYKLEELENKLDVIDSFLHSRKLKNDDLIKSITLIEKCEKTNLLNRCLSNKQYILNLISHNCSKKLTIHSVDIKDLTKKVLKTMAKMEWMETEVSNEYVLIFCLEDLKRNLIDKKYRKFSNRYDELSHKSESEISVNGYNSISTDNILLEDFINKKPEIYNPRAFENLMQAQNRSIGILKRQKVDGEYAVKKWRHDWKENLKTLKDLEFSEKAIKKAEKLGCWLIKKQALLKHI